MAEARLRMVAWLRLWRGRLLAAGSLMPQAALQMAGRMAIPVARPGSQPARLYVYTSLPFG